MFKFIWTHLKRMGNELAGTETYEWYLVPNEEYDPTFTKQC